MPRVAAPLKCKEDEIIELNNIANSPFFSTDMQRRAKIILLANEGTSNKDIARELKSNENTVAMWRRRFLNNRIDGLRDLERPGRRGGNGDNKRQAVVDAAVQNSSASVKELAEQSGTSEATARRALKDAGISVSGKRSYEVKASLELNKVCVDVKGLYISESARAIVLRIDNSLNQTMDEGVLTTRNRELAVSSGDELSLPEILDKMCTNKKEKAVREIKLDEFLKKTDDSLKGAKHVAVILSPKYRLPSGLLFKNMDIIITADENSWLANVSMCFRLMADQIEGKKVYESLVRYIRSRTTSEEALVWTRGNLSFDSVPAAENAGNIEESAGLFAGNSYSNYSWVKYGYATREGEYVEFSTAKYDVLPERNENIYGNPYSIATYSGEVVSGVRSLFAEAQKNLAEEYINGNIKKKL